MSWFFFVVYYFCGQIMKGQKQKERQSVKEREKAEKREWERLR
jgi:hypothetical protein